MNEILAALSEQQAELDGLISPVDDAAWDRPSRCDGWTNSDVMLHLAQTNEMALASLQHRMRDYLDEMLRGLPPSANVDDAAGAMVDKERGASPSEIYARWQTGVDAMTVAFNEIDPHERVTWVAGELSAYTLATTRLSETWIHTNDVAFGLDAPLSYAPRIEHIARLAWRTLPYAFGRAGRTMQGTVKFELTAPNGDAWVFGDGQCETVLRGEARELCEVAGQRAQAADTELTAEGPDADDVLELVRTFA